MRKDTHAFELGYEAYYNVCGNADNPYCEETQEEQFDDWNEGWRMADSDCDADAMENETNEGE